MLKLLLNITAYYLAWFACIISASQQKPWHGLIVSLVITLIQLFFYIREHKASHIIKFMACLSVIGFSIDCIMYKLKFIGFSANPFSPYLAPPWLIGLWLSFAFILFAFSRKYFQYVRSFMIMAFFGFPLSYYAGINFGAANLPNGKLSLLILAIIWAITLPLILYYFSDQREKKSFEK